MPRDTELIKQRTRKRHEKISKRFEALYNKQRLRFDDVVNQLADEFTLSPAYVERILKQFSK